MKAKVKNQKLDWKIFIGKGFQMLTGKTCFRANDVPCGVCYVDQDDELAHPYARGERVVFKVYIGKGSNIRIEEQLNPDLKELCIWIPIEEFRKMINLNIGTLPDGLMTI